MAKDLPKDGHFFDLVSKNNVVSIVIWMGIVFLVNLTSLISGSIALFIVDGVWDISTVTIIQYLITVLLLILLVAAAIYLPHLSKINGERILFILMGIFMGMLIKVIILNGMGERTLTFGDHPFSIGIVGWLIPIIIAQIIIVNKTPSPSGSDKYLVFLMALLSVLGLLDWNGFIQPQGIANLKILLGSAFVLIIGLSYSGYIAYLHRNRPINKSPSPEIRTIHRI